jgi:fructokinase
MDGKTAPQVVCIGEVLWDVFPTSRRLGGAPFNVAYHLAAFGTASAMVSRVGRDADGDAIRRTVREHGLDDTLIQADPTLPTGKVTVTLDSRGVPRYVIHAPAAWDALEATSQAGLAAQAAAAVVYGSLAQRREPSRSAIRSMLRTRALKVFDVNLRPPHDDRCAVEHLLHRSDLVKLNDHELERLGAWFELGSEPRAACASLAARFGLQAVCVTRGEHGAALWDRGQWYEHPGYRVTVADTVGSGDAFLAALLARRLEGAPSDEALALANAAGAYVAAQPGATPPISLDAVRKIMQ